MTGRKRIRDLEMRVSNLEKNFLKFLKGQDKEGVVNRTNSAKLLRKDKYLVSIGIERKREDKSYYVLSMSEELVDKVGFKDWVYVLRAGDKLIINQNANGEGKRLCYGHNRYFVRLSSIENEYREGYYKAGIVGETIQIDLKSLKEAM